MTASGAPVRLPRAVGLAGAVLLGLGAMLGTGVFLSLGLAAGIAGPAVLLAVLLAAVLAMCNGLSSAQLAASHPVSGGTYEYGYRYLSPWLGFTAGWVFLCAKAASAATGALALAGYILTVAGEFDQRWRVPLALTIVAGMTLLVAGGIRRSNRANAVMVTVTVAALVAFIVAGLPILLAAPASRFTPFVLPVPDTDAVRSVLYATAFVFVAYTGYGRIATLGEEVRDPRRVIPIAVATTILLAMVFYLGVAAVGIAANGARGFAAAAHEVAAPLQVVARRLGGWPLRVLIAVGAATALLGVLLNLLLGLSRVVLAMGRRGDLPIGLAKLDAAGHTPARAVAITGIAVAAITLVHDVQLTWSFSAFTVLLYYAVTNLAALRLPPGERRYPRGIPLLGLTGCLGLAVWVEPRVWITGSAIVAAGWLWHATRRIGRSSASP